MERPIEITPTTGPDSNRGETTRLKILLNSSLVLDSLEGRIDGNLDLDFHYEGHFSGSGFNRLDEHIRSTLDAWSVQYESKKQSMDLKNAESLSSLAYSQATGAAVGLSLGYLADSYVGPGSAVAMSAVNTISGMSDTLVGFASTLARKITGKTVTRETERFAYMNIAGLTLKTAADMLGLVNAGSLFDRITYDCADNATSIASNGIYTAFRSGLSGLRDFCKKPYVVGTAIGITAIALLHTAARSLGYELDSYASNALLIAAFNVNSYATTLSSAIYMASCNLELDKMVSDGCLNQLYERVTRERQLMQHPEGQLEITAPRHLHQSPQYCTHS